MCLSFIFMQAAHQACVRAEGNAEGNAPAAPAARVRAAPDAGVIDDLANALSGVTLGLTVLNSVG